MFGGRSIIDPDGFPFAAKQTALLERLTPRSEGGPNPNTDPSQENENPTLTLTNCRQSRKKKSPLPKKKQTLTN
jgi:chemotaxis protein MotB